MVSEVAITSAGESSFALDKISRASKACQILCSGVLIQVIVKTSQDGFCVFCFAPPSKFESSIKRT